MRTVWWIARRELQSFLHTWSGYVIVAALLSLHGVWFNVVVLRGEQTSFQAMEGFFFHSSGFVAAVSVLLSMRLFAEEKQTGTYMQLLLSPAHEWQIVLGKFVGGYMFLCLYLACTLCMPLLITVHGTVSLGHVVVGYGGLMLISAATMAVGTLASMLAPSQLLAAVTGAVMVTLFFVCWMIARKVEGALGDFIGFLDFMDLHYRSFSRGIIKLSSTVYYLSVTYGALLLAVSVMAARRWREG